MKRAIATARKLDNKDLYPALSLTFASYSPSPFNRAILKLFTFFNKRVNCSHNPPTPNRRPRTSPTMDGTDTRQPLILKSERKASVNRVIQRAGLAQAVIALGRPYQRHLPQGKETLTLIPGLANFPSI